MQKPLRNFAFIDGQNLYLGIKSLGWGLDYKKFRVYLKEKYAVKTAFIFLGYLPANQRLYGALEESGYKLVFKPVIPNSRGEPKGNVDADLVFQAMLDYNKYNQAVIVTSDGDFYRLVQYIYSQGKLKAVLSPYDKTCSVLLKRSAREKIIYLNNLKDKLQLK